MFKSDLFFFPAKYEHKYLSVFLRRNPIKEKVDGIVGTKTWAYLCEGAASMPVLRKGAFDALVGKVQQALKDGGFYKGAVDKDFGAKTETAVKAFQTSRLGLKADGVIGANTWSHLSRFDAHGKSCFVDNLTL